jgi:hypothetical protein
MYGLYGCNLSGLNYLMYLVHQIKNYSGKKLQFNKIFQDQWKHNLEY